MSAIAGINGDVWISTSPSTSLGSPETCNDSGDHIHYFASVHQAWDPTQPFTVQYSPNGSTGWTNDTSGDYVVYWPVGGIVFSTARTVGTNNFIRISTGNYFTLSALSGAHMWKAQAKVATKDVTPFQASGGWAQYAGTVKSQTFSVDCYRDDAQILNEMLTSGVGKINISGGIILCQLWLNEAGGDRYQFYGLPTQLQQTEASNDVEKQTINFQAYGPLYWVSSNSFSATTVIQM